MGGTVHRNRTGDEEDTMSAPIPPPYYPPQRRTNPLAFIAKSFLVGIGLLVCVGIVATIASTLPSGTALWFVLAVWWIVLALFVIRVVRFAGRRRAQRQQEAAQQQQWMASMAWAEQQARERAAYDAEYARRMHL